MATCKTNGHLRGVGDKCMMCGIPMAPYLKPCPWCGETPISTVISCGKVFLPVVSCETEGCPVAPTTDDFDTAEQAIAAWNTRRA